MDKKLVTKLLKRQKNIPCGHYCHETLLCDDCQLFKDLWEDYYSENYFGM